MSLNKREIVRSFGNYMQEWLYGEKGYYRKALIGPKGDFYTSVSLSKFFGGAIAFYIIRLLEEEKLFLPLKIVEIGSHHGYFLSDIASFLNALSVGVMEKCEFVSCEPLKELQKLQQTIFKQATQLDLMICDLKDLDFKGHENAFVISNELFDAFACEIIKDNQMLFITHDHQGVWGNIDEPTKELLKNLNLKQGCAPLFLEAFIKDLLEKLNEASSWVFLSFDYGDEVERKDLHLRAFKNHQALDFKDILNNLASLYQQSDLTYDVNFSLVRFLFEKHHAQFSFFKSQANALLDMGLMGLLETFSKSVGYERYLKEAAKIKPLISPGGLGERFKALEFVKK
ncbi:class I SAM-dependent methyltransferase [Helicobacter pylori]|uniref:class I SAM-dependent methyltransferase n=1 Tax=Helicobacter pylori TaxID=210 RepID=UPI0018E999A2|nr:class I SAM-dependent methyltransferase [Helicobacter pylori]WQU57326.1 class I SAM-dependent methyltransferase [Helicobacter pylori]